MQIPRKAEAVEVSPPETDLSLRTEGGQSESGRVLTNRHRSLPGKLEQRMLQSREAYSRRWFPKDTSDMAPKPRGVASRG